MLFFSRGIESLDNVLQITIYFFPFVITSQFLCLNTNISIAGNKIFIFNKNIRKKCIFAIIIDAIDQV